MYPEPDESNPHLPTLYLITPINISFTYEINGTRWLFTSTGRSQSFGWRMEERASRHENRREYTE
jgi:hypothetical protein